MNFQYKLINADRLEPIYSYGKGTMVEIDVAHIHIPHVGKSIACLLSIAGKPDFGFVIDTDKPINYDLKHAEETFYLCVGGVAKTNTPGRYTDWASLNRLNNVFKPNLPSYFYQLSDHAILLLEPVVVNNPPDFFDVEGTDDRGHCFYSIKVVTTKESIVPLNTRNSYTPNHIYSDYILFNGRVIVPTDVVIQENGVLTKEVIDYINSRYNLHCLSTIQKEDSL